MPVQPHWRAALLQCSLPAASSQRDFLKPSSPCPAHQGHHSLFSLITIMCCTCVHQLMSHSIPKPWSLLSPPVSHIDQLSATSQAREHSNYKMQGMIGNVLFVSCFSSSLFYQSQKHSLETNKRCAAFKSPLEAGNGSSLVLV